MLPNLRASSIDKRPCFPGGSDFKESTCNAGDWGFIPGSGRSPGESSIPAWRIPKTNEPDGLQSMGSQRVGHNWATNTFTYSLSIDITNAS